MILTVKDLDAACQRVLAGSKSFGIDDRTAVFETLYTFGFRLQELKYCHTWQFLDDRTIEAKTFKNNNLRLIEVRLCHPLLVNSVFERRNLLYLAGASTFEREFMVTNKPQRLFVNEKSITCHVFRHLVVKKLAERGASYAKIADYMGMRSAKTAKGYAISRISDRPL